MILCVWALTNYVDKRSRVCMSSTKQGIGWHWSSRYQFWCSGRPPHSGGRFGCERTLFLMRLIKGKFCQSHFLLAICSALILSCLHVGLSRILLSNYTPCTHVCMYKLLSYLVGIYVIASFTFFLCLYCFNQILFFFEFLFLKIFIVAFVM